MPLSVMEFLLDFQRPLETGAGASKVALSEKHAGQCVEGRGNVGMDLGAMDLLLDFQCPLEAGDGSG